MKNLCLTIAAAAVSMVSFAQPLWELKGEYVNVFDVQNINTYAYVNNNTLHFTTDGDQTSVQSDLSLGVFDKLTDVYQVNSDLVYAAVKKQSGVNNSVNLWKSTDGGTSFVQEASLIPAGYTGAGVTSFSLHFFNETTGISWGLVTDSTGDPVDIMMRTTDGGLTWNQINTAIEDIREIYFSTAGRAHFYTQSNIYESTDMGATWNELADNPLSSASNFSDAGSTIWGVGWAGSNNPCRVKSTDGGINWTTFTIPDEDNGGLRECNSFTGGGSAIAARNAELIVLGKEGGNRNRMVYSSDEGSSWEIMAFVTDPDIGFAFPQVSRDRDVFFVFLPFQEELYFFGNDGSGGTTGIPENTQEKLSFFPNPAFNEIRFTEPQTGMLKMFNMQGQLVHTASLNQQQTIPIGELPKGVYIISINNIASKLIKH